MFIHSLGQTNNSNSIGRSIQAPASSEQPNEGNGNEAFEGFSPSSELGSEMGEHETTAHGAGFLANLLANYACDESDSDRAATEQAKLDNHRNHLEHVKHVNHVNHLRNAAHHQHDGDGEGAAKAAQPARGHDAEQAKLDNHHQHLEHLKHLNHINRLNNASHHPQSGGIKPTAPAHTATPTAPAHTATPTAPAHTATPTAPAHTATPTAPTHTATPTAPAHTATPTAPAHTSTPTAPAHTATPTAPAHTATPTAPTHTSSPNNGGSQSAANLEKIPGLNRGKTLFHTDFNGARGAGPGSQFGTNQVAWNETKLHQDKEVGDIDSSNTELDGSGHLAMTATKENGQYKQASFFTDKKVTFNLKDHPEGVVVETRAKYPTVDGVKFNPLWITTDHWTANGAKGEKPGDTIEYDAAEGDAVQDSEEGGINKRNGITIHNAYNAGDGSATKDNYGGFQHQIAAEDGKYHTYTVKIQGDGSVTEFVDGAQVFSKAKAFPTDKDLSIKASLALYNKNAVDSTRSTASKDGLDSQTTGYIDYLDVSSLA